MEPETPSAATRACPDCGAPGAGAFCTNCGEEMEPRVLRIRHYVRDVFQEVLSFDSKFLHSIPALLFRPGFLAREFVAGRRKRYLSPLKLHLIIAVLLFLAIGHETSTQIERLDVTNREQNLDSVLNAAQLKQAERGDTTKIPSVSDVKTSIRSIQGMETEIGPYVLLMISTPVFALFLALLYRKQHRLYVEHLMFSLYFFSFAYLVLIAPALWLHNILFSVAGILLCCYLYFALKKFYDDRGISLLVRTLAGIMSCAFIGIFTFVLSYLISLGISIALGNIPHDMQINGTIRLN